MVFLVCHSVKLFINGYEVYEMVKKSVDTSSIDGDLDGGEIQTNDVDNFVPPIRVTMNVTKPDIVAEEVKIEGPEQDNIEPR